MRPVDAISSDVEMDGRIEERGSRTPDLHPPSSAATSRRSSFDDDRNGNNGSISINNMHGTGASSSHAPISIPVLVHSPSPSPSTNDAASISNVSHSAAGPSGVSSASASAAKPSSSSAKPPSSAKPRSSKPARPARSPSPSPPPPPVYVPLQTIRLEIRLGGPSNYEVDISRLAKDSGQRPPTPPPVIKKVADSSDSEEEEDEKGKDKDDKSKDDKVKSKKKKRKNVTSEYYDTSDPFIDDSELALDERQFFAQTKQQGFYVSSGEVALLKDKMPKKPKSKKISFAAGLHPSLNTKEAAEGSRETPIAIDGDRFISESISTAGLDSEHAGQKRKRQNSTTEGGKRKKTIDETMFHSELQASIKVIKELVGKENWEQKGKFPPGLKPELAKLAILAIKLDEYDDDFFSLMPMLFPYNKFTMTKLIKRTVFSEHLALLTQRQDVLLGQLAELARVGFTKAQEEWEKNVVAWDKRQEKLRTDVADASTGTGSAGPTRHPTEEMEVDNQASASQAGGGLDGEGGKEGKDGKDHGQHPPAKRYRLTDEMKAIVWELVLLSNECCRLENEKNSLEGSVIQISDQGLRKVLYQKIVAAFPEGWMSSGQISRDVSAMKKKLEREAMEQEIDE
ncbi:hypothetical protein B0H34DRAFT_720972 [Crassisporium funariophilum]|nr:hypothetical protein B0H34DRAFT_720972 [Crassisporium funariophilum]